jgi:hypothetical protein
MVQKHFELLGHEDFGMLDTNGDVFVHRDFAYVGTWSDPCTGRGVKIVDVSRPRSPQMVATAAARDGTSAEDMVVRSVSTSFFTGDLMGVGIQRCSDDPALDSQQFGLDLWDVTDPRHPMKLSFLGVTNGGGGVHELDLFQRGSHVYALLATPFSEFFDPVPGGDFRIVDVTDPRHPVQVGEWGAFAHGLTPGPYFGLGSFGATFDHSARASADGMKAYVSYWDLGVLTFDIADPTHPVLIGQTQFAPDADGDAHSVADYRTKRGRTFLLQNDEDFDPESPSHILFGPGGFGIGLPSPGGLPVWSLPGHSLTAPVVRAANQGCSPTDYPVSTPGKIAVVTTPFPFFDPLPGDSPLCLHQDQEAAAEAAGAAAVVHEFIATATSPQWFDFGSVSIPVLFTDHATAMGMVAAGLATLAGREPSWGFLQVFDAATGEQVAKFDRLPGVHELPSPLGDWSIHNTETAGRIAYSSWYSNGVVALDLRPLDRRGPGDPRLVGQFVPPPGASPVPFLDGKTEVWGVAVGAGEDDDDTRIYLSDMVTGLWIVEPKGPASPD